MKTVSLSVLASVLLAAGAASATPVTLTFSGLKNGEAVEGYYDGGSGSEGSTGGPNYGVTFGSNSLALTGGGYNPADVPAPSTGSILFFTTGSAVMNVAAGFTDGFSFYYTSPDEVGSLNIYSGLNGTGTLLFSESLPQTIRADEYNDWVEVGATLPGAAESVVFGGAANYIGFADITFGSATVEPPAVAATPEPSSLILAGTGILALAGSVRRRLRI